MEVEKSIIRRKRPAHAPKLSAASPTTASADIASKPNSKAWKVYELKGHLSELGLQVTGKREILIERLEGHYAGTAQV